MSVKAHIKVEDKDTGWTELFKRVREAEKGRVKVGVLADDAKGGEEHGELTVAQLASVLHFGTENGVIPARPFLTMAFDQHREELAKMGGELLDKVIDGKIPQDKALGLIGAKLAAEAKLNISAGNKLEPNKPSTVTHKGSSKPLIDTGRLLNAITWAVDKGEE